MTAHPANGPMAMDSALDLDELKRQQAALQRGGRLSRLHVAIVAASVVVTVLAWYTSSTLIEQRAEQRFKREIGRVIELVEERMHHYEDALLAGVASIQSNEGVVSRERWRRYADSLQINERYPGISGIGVIFHVAPDEVDAFTERAAAENPGYAIHPPHEFDFRLPIAYIEPEAPNAAALGLDVAFEHNRRTAALRARRLGTTQISGPIVLVQDAGRTPGFLFYAPYYAYGGDGTPAQGVAPRYREQQFRGLVYAPLVVESLVAGTLDRRSRDVRLSIRDGDEVLYTDADAQPDEDEHLPYTAARQVEMYGRTWTFEFRGSGSVAGESASRQPRVVLIGGLLIELMLVVLFWLMSRSNRRMIALAEGMTDDLSRHARALADTNEELRNYAHIVSHDLQTPIRGIQDLAGFIREDLGEYLASNDAVSEVGTNLDRLCAQAARGQTLITGILDYSSVGVHDESLSSVDVRELVEQIGATLDVRPGQLVIDGELPVFETHAVRLGQVLANLIGNAFKYHPERDRARVHVSVARHGAFHRFTVTDNGPGIEPRHHDRIFDVFEKLQTSADVHSSGIGLSIVRKSVELLGGSVSVASAAGQGATFRFDWPVANVRRAA